MGVSAILEGSVRRAGNLVRITVQLIDARKDTHLWSEVYDCDLSDLSNIFSIQSKVAQTIADELKAVLSPAEKQLIGKVSTVSIDAYDAYLKGMFYWRKLTENDIAYAMKYFALAGFLTWSEWNWNAAWPEWKRSLDLNPNNPDVLVYY